MKKTYKNNFIWKFWCKVEKYLVFFSNISVKIPIKWKKIFHKSSYLSLMTILINLSICSSNKILDFSLIWLVNKSIEVLKFNKLQTISVTICRLVSNSLMFFMLVDICVNKITNKLIQIVAERIIWWRILCFDLNFQI